MPLLSHSAGDIQLAHCQLVIARENGFDSWPEMKKHIDHLSVIARLTKDRSDNGAEQIALDQPDTLHIRCGSDIKHSLELAGFSGQFLEFSQRLSGSYWMEPDNVDGLKRVFITAETDYSKDSMVSALLLSTPFSSIFRVCTVPSSIIMA
ncbi:hypothetical protein [Oceanospirillum sediminis]|uniref:Uncharacterized protein n=1 Tax=Oceanospirillum sediminis TaxID=2760088 RepID=A0A839ISA2_9GAMM|nr:hypothetical protein [Oceanospirillum sediminis]MBB1487359.1 hypothetical protein [Oceanospirillum sediminis]